MSPPKLPMIPSKALVHVVETDVVLALDPLTEWLKTRPLEIPRVLPVIIKSTGEFMRLIQKYPDAARELRILAREVGKHRMGFYDGR